MHVTGIVAEYNPFHNGHAHMIKEIRKKHPETVILAVMSGSFTQRGSAAILDKWSRAQMAVEGGCNLVVELPFVFAVRSAQEFARGAVLLMERLGTVDEIAFGTECNEPEKLRKAAERIDTPSFQCALHASIEKGNSYAHALAAELSHETELTEATLKEANTILAVEYLRSLHLMKSRILPFPIKRFGAGYHDESLCGSTASATAIRKKLQGSSPDWSTLNRVLPESSMELLQRCRDYARDEMLYHPLLASLYTKSFKDLQKAHGVNEGLEHRILGALSASRSLHGLICAISSKRYPQSRIRRILTHLLVGFQREHSSEFERTGPQYARILAFDDKGRMLLRQLKRQSLIPLITKTSHALNSTDLHRDPEELTPLQRMLRFDCLGTDLQGLCYVHPKQGGRDFLQAPLYLSKSIQ